MLACELGTQFYSLILKLVLKVTAEFRTYVFNSERLFSPSQCNVVSYKEKKIYKNDPAVGEKERN